MTENRDTREISPIRELTTADWAARGHDVVVGADATVHYPTGTRRPATVRWASSARRRIIVDVQFGDGTGAESVTFYLRDDGTYGCGRAQLLLGSAG